MTIPGMNIITASAFMAAIGDVGRFPDRKKLVGYLGLDPKVRESGTTAASRGADLKAGLLSGALPARGGELVGDLGPRSDARLL
jgi:transposase